MRRGTTGRYVDPEFMFKIVKWCLSDVFVLLDTCFAADFTKGINDAEYTKELLAATISEESGTIKDSFTRNVVKTIRDMGIGRITSLHSKMVAKFLPRTPFHCFLPLNGSDHSILLHNISSSIETVEYKESKEDEEPTVLLAVHINGDPDPGDDWLRFLTSNTPKPVKGVQIQSIDKSNSTILLLRLPVTVYDLLPKRSSYQFIGYIDSEVQQILKEDRV